MVIRNVTPGPEAPSQANPGTFATKAEEFLAWLSITLPAEMGNAISDMNTFAQQLAAIDSTELGGEPLFRAVVRLTSASFYEAGNHVGDYPATRAVVLAQTASGVGYVSSATYNSGANRTEVTVTGITVDTGLTQAVLGLDPKYAPKIPTSLTAAANSIPIAGAGGALDASWVPPADWKATSAFTRTGAGSGTVTNNAANQSLFRAGRPLRALSGATYTYHIVTAYSAGTVTVAGPALPTTIDALAYGDMTRVIPFERVFYGAFSDAADSALLANDNLEIFDWPMGAARLVWFRVRPKVDDSGASQPRINMSIAGSAVSTSNSNAGLAVSDAAWVETTTDINSSNYGVVRNQRVEVSADANGSNKDAKNLTLQAVFILE